MPNTNSSNKALPHLESSQNAAAYIRVSTNRQEELSPDAQKRELLKYAHNHNIHILDFYQDNGISGKTAERRPEFQQMISRAKSSEHPYDYILVWKFSRFARNQEESIVYKSLLKKNGVEVVSITEPLIDGPFASLIERIIEWMDEYYSIRLAGDVKRGMTEKALRGGYQSAPPLGYHMNTEHIPQIYEPEAVIVREIYRLCQEKYNLTTIARMLNDAGYRTRRNNRFERRTVLYILQNPFYIGKIRWNRIQHGSNHPNKENEIILVQGCHQPLFTEDYFTEIQKMIHPAGSSHVDSSQRRSETLYKHYLCGILKCPICGKNLAYHSSAGRKKSYPYFLCWQYSKGLHKNGGNISVRRCEEAIKQSLQALLDTIPDSIQFCLKQQEMVCSPLLKKYKTALAEIEHKKQRIRDSYIEGIDTKEEYKKSKKRLAEEQAKLELLIHNEERTLDGTDPGSNTHSYRINIQDILQLITDPEVDVIRKHRAIASILERVEYHRETDTFQFYYRYS